MPTKAADLRGAATRYNAAEGDRAVIQLHEDQLQALDTPQQPPVVVDPRTGQEYLLIRRDVYERVRGLLKPLGRAWDNPADDDLIREDA
jgi:hypothetical protein